MHLQASILFHGRLVRDDNGGHPRHRGPHQGGAREAAPRGRGARDARRQRVGGLPDPTPTLTL